MAQRKPPTSYEQIMATMKQENVTFVNLEFTDVVGIAKCVTIPAKQFSNCIENGRWFDGSALEGFARVAESDMYLFPDLSTFTILPGRLRGQSTTLQGTSAMQTENEVVARVICEIRTPDGTRFDGDPRNALLRALERAHSMGFKYQVAPELEFFLLQFEENKPIPLPHDKGSYFDLSTDTTISIRSQMVSALQKMDIKIEASHHEVAPGQHEIDFEIGDALRIADGLTTSKYIIKALAAHHGLYATFLPKPFYGINGSGMHIHQQLINLETGKNAFVDEHDEYGLSEIGRQFIAGQLSHAHSMCGILAPLVNSYKRLVRGYEAPVFVNWGRVNRQGLIRVPYSGSDPDKSLRIELRCADATCNPHLAFAVMLYAGLDGIQRKMTVQPAMDENIFLQDESERLRPRVRLLPLTLGEALEAMHEDTLIRKALGDLIYEGFMDAKSIEWAEYRQQVHSWEIERYLPQF